MKFTKKEIILCKQIAKKHWFRKEIKKGAWIIQEDRADIPLLVIDTQGQSVILNVGYDAKTEAHHQDCVLLWTLSDCLEFLREELVGPIGMGLSKKGGSVSIYSDEEDVHERVRGNGKTLLEACLKAVLAVLEEEK